MGFKGQNTSDLRSGNTYFNDYSSTNAYVELSFGFPARKLSLVNDHDTDPVQVSWDGSTLHYQVEGAEYKDIDPHSRTSVYIKSTGGNATVRITAE